MYQLRRPADIALYEGVQHARIRCAFLFARQRKKIVLLTAVRTGTDILLSADAYCRHDIRVGINVDLNCTGMFLQVVMKNSLLEESRIVAAFNVNLINFKKALRVVAASLHFDFGSIHHSVYLFLPICRHIFTNRKSPVRPHIVPAKWLYAQNMQACQTNQNVIQFHRVTKMAFVSVSADLGVKHRRVASDDWYSLGVALFHFLVCILFEMLLVNNDNQGLCFRIVVGNELF